jgi:hypothetical protein
MVEKERMRKYQEGGRAASMDQELDATRFLSWRKRKQKTNRVMEAELERAGTRC